MEFLIFVFSLLFIFLGIQVWFLWRDINKDDFKINTIINDSFFKKNSISIFFFAVFYIAHEIFEGANISNALIYLELMELLGIISIVLFSYFWYLALRSSMPKRSLPIELAEFTR